MKLSTKGRYAMVALAEAVTCRRRVLLGYFGETLEQGAVREAREETTLDVSLRVLLGNYSDPLRDARGHTVSAVYIAEAQGEPRAADDAMNLVALGEQKFRKVAAVLSGDSSDQSRF